MTKTTKPTYDIIFHDNYNSNSKGFELNLEDAHDYVKTYNGTNESYFQDYKGGIVQIVCNQTQKTAYETTII